jgi:phage tail-like protein
MPQVPREPIELTVSFRLKVGASDWFFQEVSGLTSESEVIEVREGGRGRETSRVPGNVKWSNIELKRGLVADKGLWEWRKQVIDGKLGDARANGTIEMIDQEGNPIAVFSIKNAWPSKYTGGAMSLEPGSAFESITIAHEGIERTK